MTMDYLEKRLEDTAWMAKEYHDSRHSFDNSLTALIEAVTELKKLAVPYRDNGYDLSGIKIDYATKSALAMCCQVMYTECKYLVDVHSAVFNKKKLEYLELLRNVCAHRFGSTMKDYLFLDAVVFSILPIAESVKSMLMEELDRHPESSIPKETVRNLNTRKKTGLLQRLRRKRKP